MGAIHQALLSVAPSAGAGLLLLADDFNRADSGTLGTCPAGTEAPQAWVYQSVPFSGTQEILSNQTLFTHGVNPTMVSLDAGTADCIVEATLVTAKPNNGLWFRGSGLDGYLFVNQSGTTYQCYRLNGGFTLVFNSGAGTPTPANGDVLKVVLSGSSITFFVNGVNLGNITDATYNTHTEYGFYGGNAGGDDGGVWDDFSVTSN